MAFVVYCLKKSAEDENLQINCVKASIKTFLLRDFDPILIASSLFQCLTALEAKVQAC